MVTVSRPPHERQPTTGPTIGSPSSIAWLSLPQFPRRRAALPQRIQVLLVAQRIHGLPEAPMHPGGQLTVRSQIFHGFLFPNRIMAVDEFQHAGLENEDAAVDEAPFGGWLLLEGTEL